MSFSLARLPYIYGFSNDEIETFNKIQNNFISNCFENLNISYLEEINKHKRLILDTSADNIYFNSKDGCFWVA